MQQILQDTYFVYRQKWMQIKPLYVHKTVGIVLAYLNCHIYNYSDCGGFHFLLVDLGLVGIYLFACSR